MQSHRGFDVVGVGNVGVDGFFGVDPVGDIFYRVGVLLSVFYKILSSPPWIS